ncbi:MAG: hypothetical protein K6G26_07375 [Lachnospiraceae bacterium]|nr:hypothetical protein [Lachnospiraceae bacterium]
MLVKLIDIICYCVITISIAVIILSIAVIMGFEPAKYVKNNVSKVFASDINVEEETDDENEDTSEINPDEEVRSFVYDAIINGANKFYEAYPYALRKSSERVDVKVIYSNIDGEGKIAASVKEYNKQDKNDFLYEIITLDISDYNIENSEALTEELKTKLAADLAHEVNHIIMNDVVINHKTYDDRGYFPKWFIEGFAQTSSGPGTWFEKHIDLPTSDDNYKTSKKIKKDITEYVSKLDTLPYGAGYVATLYLGIKASGYDMENDISAHILTGLRIILKDIIDGKNLDEAIYDNTEFGGLEDFENYFENAEGDVIPFVLKLREGLNKNGAGSLLGGGIAIPKREVFMESKFDLTANNLSIDS